jgi:glucose/arabinose dehydrogenase
VLRNLSLIALIPVFFSTLVYATDPELEFTQVATRSAVVDIANAGDGSDRLFLVEKTGLIYIIENGNELETPFLDFSSAVLSAGIEQGLLSMAFAPDYETSGYFYIWYTAQGGATVLSRLKVANNPNLADPSSEQKVMTVDQPASNHNGGSLQFGPDGMLYLGLGDGGGAFDPQQAGQDGSTLLGKLIRIDVDPVNGTYAIPAGNPFVGVAGTMDEIWALGLRNPWRISFDRMTGDLFIGDVGQVEQEEINFQAASSVGGENYGWSVMEGSLCVGGGNCDQSGLVLPVAKYNHDNGDCSIIGGEMYRGQSYPNMYGVYFFADFCTGRIWGMANNGNNWITILLADTPYQIQTFGLGEDGNLYLANKDGGVYLVSDGAPASVNPSVNAGMNDAWFNQASNGQGLLVSVFEDSDVMFLAWFTYDVERPPEDATALLGDPGHRWLTAQGTYLGNMAMLDIYQTVGGVFDSFDPPPDAPEKIGTMTIKWSSCNAAEVTYMIDSPALAGEFPIQRVVVNNVPLCEALQ